MAERLANLGYFALGKETTAGTAVIPSDWIPLYSESMTTNLNLIKDNPVVGLPWLTYQVVQGQRDHQGKITVMAEPNTTARLLDMLMTIGTQSTTYTFTTSSCNATIGATYTNNGVTFTVTATVASSTTLVATSAGAPLSSGTLTKASGTGDATITFSAAVVDNTTWPFTPDISTNSYTLDVSTGVQVFRFVGCGVETIAQGFQNGNEMTWDLDVSGLLAFSARTLAGTPTGSSPYTVTLDTEYDPSPTNGLVVGDTLQVYSVSGGTYTNFTVASIVNGTQITTTTNVTGNVVGDIVTIRPQTPSFNNLTPFLWSRTQFCFGATIGAAQSAAQTQLETGSSWSLTHSFENKAGSKRSGSFDPASLPRLQYDAMFKSTKFFDTPQDEAAWADIAMNAVSIVHYSGASDKLVVNFNNLKKNTVKPAVKSASILYSEIDHTAQYDQTTSAACSVSVINGLVTV